MTNINVPYYGKIISALALLLFLGTGLTSAQTGIQLNGTNQYVTFGQATTALGTQNFTLECWFKKTGTGVVTTSGASGILALPLVTKGMAESDGGTFDMNYFLGINGTTFVSGRSYGPANVLAADFEEGTGSASPGLNHPVAGVTPVLDDVWYHAAVTYDITAHRWRLYLNGILEKDTVIGSGSLYPQNLSTQHAAAGTALLTTGLPGSSSGYGPGYLNGVVDEVRIWGIVRSQAEIQAAIDSQITSPRPGLLGRWGLNDGSGTTALNSIAGSPDGTLINGPSWVDGAPMNITFLPPADPSGLTAGANGSVQIDLQWVDNAGDEQMFNIERSTSGSGGPFSLRAQTAANVTTFSDTGLSPSTEYCYRVSASNSFGSSDYTGVACAATTAPPNNGLKFGSGNACVTFGTGSSLSTPTFTIETWFRRDGTGASVTTGTGGIPDAIPLLSKGTSEDEVAAHDINYFLGIRASDSVLCADFEEGAAGSSPSQNHPVAGVTHIQRNVWYHAAATYDGTAWKLYLNGSLENQLTVGQPAASATLSPTALGTSIRSNGTTTQGFFDGTIDEARIWSYPRTGADIQSAVNTPITTPQTGLIGRWGMDELSGAVVHAGAGTAFDGSVVGSGFAWVSGAPFNLSVNHSPDAPALVTPSDGATDVSTSPTLSVNVSDPDADYLDVGFYGRQAGTAPDFSIVELPDAQNYTALLSGATLAMFKAQTQWIANNRISRNIVFVNQVGDIVNDGSSQIEEWRRADTVMSTLENPLPGIPFSVTIGNHDTIGGTTLFNQFFGLSRFSGRPYYGGHYGSDNNSNFQLFSAGALNFIAVTIRMNAGTQVLHWADSILKAYPGRRAIVFYHDMLTTGGAWNGLGQTLYDSLKDNPNLFLISSGHSSGESRRSDTYNGNVIYTMMANYQGVTNGGNGWMRVWDFSPAGNVIHVKTYSPYLDQWNTGASSQFDLAYNMSGSAFQLIGTTTGVPSGSATSMPWGPLTASTSYEWYASVNDTFATTTGPVWGFTTAAAPPVYHTITATAGPYGSITPDGAVTVLDGDSRMFTIAPSTGYHIDSVIVNGIYRGTMSSYTFTNVLADSTIRATFAVNTYTLNVTAAGGGSVAKSPDQTTYNYGTVVQLTATPFYGWTFGGWTGDTATSANPVSVTMIANKNFTATFINTNPLVGRWAMEEGGGTVLVDSSTWLNNGAIYGTANWVTGMRGKALVFDGTTTYAAVPDTPSLRITNAITLAAWIKPSVFATQDLIKKATNGGVNGYEMSLAAATGNPPRRPFVRFNQVSNGDTYRLSARVTSEYPTNGAWMHLAATYDGATVKLYINGVLDTSKAAAFTIASNNLPLSIGAESGGARKYTGQMDDARVYNYALSAAEIQALVLSSYVITASAGPNGSINPSGAVSVLEGGSQTFTMTPSTGYHVDSVIVNGAYRGNMPEYAFSNVRGDSTIHAVFAIDQYSVTFNANGGSGSMGPQTGNYNTTASLMLNAFTRTGYTFAGWNTQAGGGGTAYADGATYTFTAGVTLYAQWTINQYTVAFHANGGTGSMSPQSGNYNTTAPLTLNSFTRTGCTFAGWNTQAGGGGAAYADGASYTFTESGTLYAQWSILHYTLTYTAGPNGSVSGTTPQTVNYGTDGSPVAAVPNPGYRFVNWSDASTANPRTDVNVTGNVTVTANFALIQYTIAMSSTNRIVAGVSPLALDGIDMQDTGSPPPPPANFVQLYFLLAPGQPVSNFAVDIRKDESTLVTHAKRWALCSVSDRISVPSAITVTNSNLPPGFKPVLFELSTGKYQNILLNPTFTYNLPPSPGEVSSFALMIGDSTTPAVTVVQPNGGEIATAGRPYTIRWTSTDGTGILRHYVYFSPTGADPYTFVDSTNGNVDSLVWTPASASATARIRVVARDSVLNDQQDVSDQVFTVNQTASYDAPAGWMLVSVPLQQTDMTPAGVFGDDYGAEPFYMWQYNASSGNTMPWLLSVGQGYWLGAAVARSVDAEGAALNSAALTLSPGFNIIGNPFVTNEPVTSLMFTDGSTSKTIAEAASSGWLSNVLYKYTGTGYAYESNSLAVWHGYWIPVLAGGISVQYSAAPGQSAVQSTAYSPEPPSSADWGVDLAASLRTPDGRLLTDQIASFGVRDDATDGFDCRYDAPRPPRNPNGEFLEISFKANGATYPQLFGTSYARDYKGSEKSGWKFRVNASHSGRVTLNWDKNAFAALGSDLKINLYDADARKVIDMKNVESYSYEQTGTDREFTINDPKQAVPASFNLAQNYPNPFNPATCIVFSVPEMAAVTLEVYNVLGQKVAVVLDVVKMEAGYHEVSFDASDLASGVYLYRMNAAGVDGKMFSQSRKMLLMK